MATEPAARLLSYDDFAALDDGQRYQVVEGQLVVTPTLNSRHQYVQAQCVRWLANHVAATRSGVVYGAPYEVVLRAERPAIVLQPDVLFVAEARRGLVTKANLQGAPDLVVEILSPSTARFDMLRKLPLYARFGVQEVWIVPLHADRVEVYSLDASTGSYGKPVLFEAGEILTSACLQGLAIPVTALFEADDYPQD